MIEFLAFIALGLNFLIVLAIILTYCHVRTIRRRQGVMFQQLRLLLSHLNVDLSEMELPYDASIDVVVHLSKGNHREAKTIVESTLSVDGPTADLILHRLSQKELLDHDPDHPSES